MPTYQISLEYITATPSPINTATISPKTPFSISSNTSPYSVINISKDIMNLLLEINLFHNNQAETDFRHPLTRLDALAIIIQLLGKDETVNSYIGENPFKDIAKSEEHIVAYAVSQGIAYGVTDSIFEPNRIITYQEFTAFLLRALGYNEKSKDFTYPTVFNKALSIGLYAPNEYVFFKDNSNYVFYGAIISISDALLTNVKGEDKNLLYVMVDKNLISKVPADNYIDEVKRIYLKR
jgi:hypothetical protein